MNDKTTYLCGGINGLSDSQCKDWREHAKANLKTKTLDPMRRDYRGIEAQNRQLIQANDLSDIAQSDFVLVNATRPSWGTAMELVYAKLLSRIVIGWCDGEIGKQSPWLVNHCDELTIGLDEAIRAINHRAERGF